LARDQPFQHPVHLARVAAQQLGDFRTREPLLLLGEQFKDVEPLVERGCAVTVGVFFVFRIGGHAGLRPPVQFSSCPARECSGLCVAAGQGKHGGLAADTSLDFEKCIYE